MNYFAINKSIKNGEIYEGDEHKKKYRKICMLIEGHDTYITQYGWFDNMIDSKIQREDTDSLLINSLIDYEPRIDFAGFLLYNDMLVMKVMNTMILNY